MKMHFVLPGSILSGAVVLALALPALAQNMVATTITAPDYASSAGADSLSNGRHVFPESDGRPGVYYFNLGARAFRKHDYRHAIDMYKVAASWAYKPAEYNLAIMYFKGQGIPADRARGAAWMILAAERGNPFYVKARDLMVTTLTKPEFQQTDEIWNQLKPTYADAVALRRAKARWAQVKAATTGSRVGDASSEYLMVGGTPKGIGSRPGVPPPVTGWGVFREALVTDGSVAYRQFQQSDNPYDPVFLKNRSGAVSVEALQPVKPAHDKSKKSNQPATDSTHPSQPPQNA